MSYFKKVIKQVKEKILSGIILPHYFLSNSPHSVFIKHWMKDKAYQEVRQKIGHHFLKLRKQKKLSLRKMEALTGIDYSWISKFEKGQVNFEIDTLLKLSSGLRIQIRDLMDFSHTFVDE